MAKVQSWEVSDSFWARVEPLIPKPKRDPNKTYKRKPGGGRKPMPAREIFELLSAFNGEPFPRKNMGVLVPSMLISCVGKRVSFCRFGKPDLPNMMRWKGSPGNGKA